MRFVAALRCLCDAQVEFVVIGGVAASLHGSAAVTLDLDICYSRNPENLEKLAAALAPHHPRLRELSSALPFVWDASVLRNGINFTLTRHLGDIDLLGEVTGVGAYVKIHGHTRTTRAFGVTFEIIDLELLILSKRAASRAKDLLGAARTGEPTRRAIARRRERPLSLGDISTMSSSSRNPTNARCNVISLSASSSKSYPRKASLP